MIISPIPTEKAAALAPRRRKQRLGALLVSLSLCGLLLAGCSTLDLEAAQQLADKGASAAATVYEDAQQTRARTTRAVDTVALTKLLASPASDHSEIIAALDAEYGTLQALLALRTQMYAELRSVYGSFGDLVRFDVAGEMKKSADSFIGIANNFIGVIDTVSGATPIGAITKGAENITRTGFSILGDEIHKRRVAESSEVIRGAVEKVAAAMKLERVFAVSLRRGLTLQQQTLLTEMEKKNLVSVAPLVAEAARSVGAEPAGDVEKQLANNPSLRDAFISWQRRRFDRSVAALEANYDAQVGLLEALVREHQKLEDGRPVDLAIIQEWIGRLISLHAALTES